MPSGKECYCERKDFILHLGGHVYYLCRSGYFTGKRTGGYHRSGCAGTGFLPAGIFPDPYGCFHTEQENPPQGADRQHPVAGADSGCDDRSHPLFPGEGGDGQGDE